jgi:patched 1 protein
LRIVHPLVSTSIQDMLAEFSQFNFTTIFFGYFLMIIYAAFTQCDWKDYWFSKESTSCLAIIGVLLVTFSSVAGLGFATWIGIHFNATTTQVVVFFRFFSLHHFLDSAFLNTRIGH